MTISNFKIGYIFWFFFLLLMVLVVVALFFKVIRRFNINGLWTTTWIGVLLIIFIIVIIIVIKDFKLIYVDEEKKRLKWFSIYAPFGNSIYLAEYIGVIKSHEHGSQGSYETAYLVDKNRITRFKINGLFYKNFDELFDALNLMEIKKYKMTFASHIKLMFIGRIKV